MLGARRSVKSVTMLERASICRFVLAGISEQKVEEIEGKIASRGAGNSGRKKCFHLRRGSRLMEKCAIVPAVSLPSTKVKI